MKYKFTNAQLKSVLKYLGWINDANFKVENPIENTVNDEHHKYIWVESFDTIKNIHKVVCSKEAIDSVIKIIQNQTLHGEIFGKNLDLKK